MSAAAERAADAVDPLAVHAEWLDAYDRPVDPHRPTRARSLPAPRLRERLDRLPDPDERVRALLAAYDELVRTVAWLGAAYAPDAALRHLLDEHGLTALPPAVIADLRPAVEASWRLARRAGLRGGAS